MNITLRVLLRLVITTVCVFPFLAKAQTSIEDLYGAIIRGDTSKKEIALVFTGDEFADGGEHIRQTLIKHRVLASFFLTGKFYSNKQFGSLIRALKQDGHYLGAHSDNHLLYASWAKRDSLLVSEEEFKTDLLKNYERMREFGIRKKDARLFLPPFEWYNAQVVAWTKTVGLTLINFTPGTRASADYTYPEMGKSYRSSAEIFQSIVNFEQKSSAGLNGFILLLHIGTDSRRTDKFYSRLDELLVELKKRGYNFCRIDELLND